ncbi:MAG: hypothetical protein FRX49_07166 [Trebouxia sp. A1-2]|nr:MAG: hypothetical protein FRX49_07166 [Trebouxia sp. A1-2]
MVDPAGGAPTTSWGRAPAVVLLAQATKVEQGWLKGVVTPNTGLLGPFHTSLNTWTMHILRSNKLTVNSKDRDGSLHLAAKSVLRVVGSPDQEGVVVVDQWFRAGSYTAKEMHEDRRKTLTVKIVLLGPCHVAVKEGTAFSSKKTISTGMMYHGAQSYMDYKPINREITCDKVYLEFEPSLKVTVLPLTVSLVPAGEFREN